MYDCKLMELGERSLWSGWAAGRSFFVVEGGWRMTDAGETGAIRHPPSATKKSAPQPIQPAKNALLISISLQSYTITYDQHTISIQPHTIASNITHKPLPNNLTTLSNHQKRLRIHLINKPLQKHRLSHINNRQNNLLILM